MYTVHTLQLHFYMILQWMTGKINIFR